MKRFRLSIFNVMSLTAIAAVDFALIKAAMASTVVIGGASTTFSIALIAFVLGILPLASLLIFLGIVLLPRRMRSKTPSSFLAGFETFGWAAISLFVILAMFTPDWLTYYGMTVGSSVPPKLESWLRTAPLGWMIDFIFLIIILTLPELIIALFGGWLTRKLGITVLIERRRGEPRAVSVAEEKEAAKTLANTPG